MPRIDTDLKLDFKDVLFRPKRSTIRSRGDVSMSIDECKLPLNAEYSSAKIAGK